MKESGFTLENIFETYFKKNEFVPLDSDMTIEEFKNLSDEEMKKLLENK